MFCLRKNLVQPKRGNQKWLPLKLITFWLDIKNVLASQRQSLFALQLFGPHFIPGKCNSSCSSSSPSPPPSFRPSSRHQKKIRLERLNRTFSGSLERFTRMIPIRWGSPTSSTMVYNFQIVLRSILKEFNCSYPSWVAWCGIFFNLLFQIFILFGRFHCCKWPNMNK